MCTDTLHMGEALTLKEEGDSSRGQGGLSSEGQESPFSSVAPSLGENEGNPDSLNLRATGEGPSRLSSVRVVCSKIDDVSKGNLQESSSPSTTDLHASDSSSMDEPTTPLTPPREGQGRRSRHAPTSVGDAGQQQQQLQAQQNGNSQATGLSLWEKLSHHQDSAESSEQGGGCRVAGAGERRGAMAEATPDTRERIQRQAGEAAARGEVDVRQGRELLSPPVARAAASRTETIPTAAQQRAQDSVFMDLGLLERISEYQDGEKGRDFWNGDAAAAEGHLALMISKHMQGDPLSYTHLGLSRAAKNGRIDVVQWLHDYTDVPRMPSAMDSAAAGGHLEIVKFLDEHRPEGGCSRFAMNGAAAGGHLEVVKWLHDNRTEGCTERAMDGAAAGGHLEMVQWLHENRSEGCSTAAMDGAAENGSLEVVKWLHHNREEGCTGDALFLAAKTGHADMVRWLLRNRLERCPANRNIFDWVADHGHLDVIKMLHEARVEGCSVRAMNWAAKNGHLETVIWLHENRAEGCTRPAMDEAASNGHLEVIQWLNSNRNEGCSIRAMNHAALNGHLHVVEWLHETNVGSCTNNAMDNAAKNGHLEIVKFLHHRRKEGCSTNALDWAAARGHHDVVMFLITNRKEGCTAQALDWSSHGGHHQINHSLSQGAKLRSGPLGGTGVTRMEGGGCCVVS